MFKLYFLDYKDHPCQRECVPNKPMVCRYTLYVETMFTMEPNCGACSRNNTGPCSTPTCLVGDGSTRLVYSINRLLPGPQLRVILLK